MTQIVSDSLIPSAERAERSTIGQWQADRLARVLGAIDGRNAFYTQKLQAAGVRVGDCVFPADLVRLPFTTKAELIEDQLTSPPWGTALTEPIERYTRYCHTSATTGRPLRWLDTADSWQSMLECWKAVYRGARVGAGDRAFFAFSFGPFLGFWTAFEAASQIGVHVVPGGGMSSEQRLAVLEAVEATVVCCTPTYALRLAEVAAARAGARPLAESAVRVLIVAGEPGGSIPATCERIERAWGARVIDHHGLTEVGPIAFGCWHAPGFLHLNEHAFLCEVIDPATLRPAADGEIGELVVTTLLRTASPVIRYRTGDLVRRQSEPCGCGRTFARLEGGILARADDMITVRGVNIYPTAIEAVVRTFDEIVEFRATVSDSGAMRSLSVEIELATPDAAAPRLGERVSERLRTALGLTVPVRIVDRGALPRFEMKARRVVVDDPR